MAFAGGQASASVSAYV